MFDKKDLAIIEVLKHNSNLSTQQISRKTNIPITTVHNRIKKLEKSGIIKGYTILLDNKKIGKAIGAYIHIVVDYKLLKEMKMSQHVLAKKLKQHEFVEEAIVVTGGTDIILKARVKDIDELDNFVIKYLTNIDGIERSQTNVVLHEI